MFVSEKNHSIRAKVLQTNTIFLNTSIIALKTPYMFINTIDER